MLNNEQIANVKDTNVKSYATVNIVLISIGFVYGCYMFYEFTTATASKVNYK